jgi:hypothetical protein
METPGYGRYQECGRSAEKAGNEWSQAKRDAMRAANGKAMGEWLSKFVRVHIMTPQSLLDARHRDKRFSVCCAGFWSCFDLKLPRYSSIPTF